MDQAAEPSQTRWPVANPQHRGAMCVVALQKFPKNCKDFPKLPQIPENFHEVDGEERMPVTCVGTHIVLSQARANPTETAPRTHTAPRRTALGPSECVSSVPRPVWRCTSQCAAVMARHMAMPVGLRLPASTWTMMESALVCSGLLEGGGRTCPGAGGAGPTAGGYWLTPVTETTPPPRAVTGRSLAARRQRLLVGSKGLCDEGVGCGGVCTPGGA